MMKKRQKQKPKHAPELMPPRIPLHDLNALAERDITLAPADTRAEYVKRCEELVLESLGRESVYTASREFWSSQRRSFDECMAFNVSLVKHSGFGVDWPRWFDEHRDAFVEAAKVVVRALPPESDAASYARAKLTYIRERDRDEKKMRAIAMRRIRENRRLAAKN